MQRKSNPAKRNKKWPVSVVPQNPPSEFCSERWKVPRPWWVDQSCDAQIQLPCWTADVMQRLGSNCPFFISGYVRVYFSFWLGYVSSVANDDHRRMPFWPLMFFNELIFFAPLLILVPLMSFRSPKRRRKCGCREGSSKRIIPYLRS